MNLKEAIAAQAPQPKNCKLGRWIEMNDPDGDLMESADSGFSISGLWRATKEMGYDGQMSSVVRHVRRTCGCFQ